MKENKALRLREMTADELREKSRHLKEELFNLRFRNSVKQLDNPLKIREVRRDLARIETVLKEQAKGIRRPAAHGEAKKA
jgi:large subunit ribosomal protein L29